MDYHSSSSLDAAARDFFECAHQSYVSMMYDELAEENAEDRAKEQAQRDAYTFANSYFVRIRSVAARFEGSR